MSAQSELLRQRFGDAAPVLPDWGSAAFRSLLDHRSVRAFRPDPLPDGLLASLVAAAQSASTSSNLQVWSVVAVEDPARKSRLAQLAGGQRQILEAPLLLVWLADLSRLRRLGEERGQHTVGLDFIEALLLGVVDAALAAQNAAVAAEALGYGINFIGGIRNYPEKVAAELALPSEAFPLFGLCVGTPDLNRAAGIKPRLPPAAILHREVYAADGEAAAIADYDRRLAAFYRAQNLPAQAWSEQVLIRVRGPEALGSRKHQAEALVRLGFHLT